MSNPYELPVAAVRLIPQRPPMCVIDRLVEYYGRQGVVETTLTRDGIFVKEDGSIESMALVEIVAQSFAAVKGYEDVLEGVPVSKGYLVEVKKFEFIGEAREGDELSIIINRVGETDDFTLAEGKVIREGEIIASGNLMVWVPGDR